MSVIPFNRNPAHRRVSAPSEAASASRQRKSGVVLLLAATLATGAGAVFGAEQVERDDTAAPAPAAPAVPAVPAVPEASAKPAVPRKPAASTQSERDRDARLRDAKKRLEEAAAEVAALSSEIASEAMERFSRAGPAFVAGPRRSIIGVVIEGADSGTGAKVSDVSPGGAAEAAGMKVGDVIIAVNGTTVKGGAREVVRMLREVEPDARVQVRVLREGKPRDFTVTARPFDARTFAYRAPPNMDFDFDFDFDPSHGPLFGSFGPAATHGGLAGMELTSLTPQLARYFGTDKGLLVVRAPRNDLYKLQDGDVILSVDGRVPSSASHLARILRSYQSGEKLTMHVMRERKALDLQITLPEVSRNRRTRAARLPRAPADI